MIGRALVAGVLCVALGSCSVQRAQLASRAKSGMIGMSSEQVLQCMGVPAGKQQAGNTEVWAYPSGGDSQTFSTASATGYGTSTYNNGYASGTAYGTGFGSSSTQHRYCVVNVVMTQGRVTGVNYTGRTGGILTQGEQCAFAVENCVR